MPKERAERFTLNHASPLARGLAFAGCLPAPITASRFEDCSPYQNHGLLNGISPANISFDPLIGRFAIAGQAAETHYITIPARQNWDRYGYALSIWIKPATWAGHDFQGIWSEGMSYPSFTFEWFYSRSSAEIQAFVGYAGSAYNLFQNQKILPSYGRWHHLLFARYAPTQYVMIIDGTQEYQATAATPGQFQTNQTSYLFRLRGDYTGHLNGSIADAIRWNATLSLPILRKIAREFANPDNTDLKIDGVPLLLPPKRLLWAIPPPEDTMPTGGATATAQTIATAKATTRMAGRAMATAQTLATAKSRQQSPAGGGALDGQIKASILPGRIGVTPAVRIPRPNTSHNLLGKIAIYPRGKDQC